MTPGRDPPEPLPALPGYEVLEVRGAGAFGLVLRARSRRLGREVAIKLLKNLPDAPTARDRFLREAKLLVGVREEGLIQILDAELAGAQPFLVLPWMAGGDLAGRIARGPPAPPAEVLAVGLRLARALGALHRRGILHRDIKPANILLDETGEAWLADLGLGKSATDSTLTGTGHMVGTPRYLAPELLGGGLATAACDVFALGVALVELATGRPTTGLAGVDGAVHASLEALRPPALRNALRELVSMDPDQRPGDGDRAAEVLEAAAGTGYPDSRSPTVTAAMAPLRSPSHPMPVRRGRPGLLVGAWVAALALLAGWLARPGPGPEPVAPRPAPVEPWQEPDYGDRLLEAVGRIPASQLASYRDPAAWPDLVERLPGTSDFQAWLAAGRIGPGGMDRALAARLAGLDEELGARGLPAVFGPATWSWPATDRVTSGPPAGSADAYVAHQVGGWFATAVRAAGEVRILLQSHLEFMKDVARGAPVSGRQRSRPLPQVGPSLQGALAFMTEEDEFHENALDAYWTIPDFRKDFATSYLPARSPTGQLMYAAGQSMRHEPQTRELLVEWLEVWKATTLRLGAYSQLGYQSPQAVLAGPPDSPAAQRLLGMVCFELARVREPDRAARDALREAGAAAMVAALEPVAPGDAPRSLRVGRAFGALFREGKLHLPPEAILAAWKTRIASREPFNGELVLMAAYDLGEAITKDPGLALTLRPLLREVTRAAATCEAPVYFPTRFLAALQRAGEPLPTPSPPPEPPR